jgi:hypothetical protein
MVQVSGIAPLDCLRFLNYAHYAGSPDSPAGAVSRLLVAARFLGNGTGFRYGWRGRFADIIPALMVERNSNGRS